MVAELAPAKTRLITGKELAMLDNVGPCELVKGRVVLVTQKLWEYFAIGVRLVWVVNPQARSVHAYRALTDAREFAVDDDLPGDDVLPGFAVAVARLFEE